jgi:hypothetical protein
MMLDHLQFFRVEDAERVAGKEIIWTVGDL